MKHLAPLFALALLAGCGDVDADGDGVPASIDCDDTSEFVFPGANEFCDGADNDCNGVVDDTYAADAMVFFVDEDGDGYGTTRDSTVACADAPPDGYVADASDCDDEDEERYPTAPELCNLKDDNCNGTIDDDPADATLFYADYDEDGFGSRTLVQRACEAPEGWIKVGNDCNDFDFYINPNAIEYCDRIDNDCDDVIDEADAEDHRVFYEDRDGDGFGDAERPIDACWLPEGYSETDDDCNDDPDADGGLQMPGIEEICFDGIDNNCNDDGDQCWYTSWTDFNLASVVMEGPGSSDYLGYAVEFAGDVDGDGYDDIVSGAYYAVPEGTSSGAGYLFYGMPDADLPEEPIETDGFDVPTWTSNDSSDYFGRMAAGIGDIDRDGYDDFAFGAYGMDENGSTSGGVTIIYGKSGKYDAGLVNVQDADLPIITGDKASTYFGSSIAPAGDLNGDGYVDVIASGHYRPVDSGYGQGAVVILPGSASRYSGESDISPYARFVGKENYDYLGYYGPSITSGDLDGDGLSDIAMGAYGALSYTGAVYAMFGGGSYSGEMVAADVADATWAGEFTYDYVGRSVTIDGDIDDDGYDDLIIGYYYANSYGGACYIHKGEASMDGGRYNNADVTVNGTGSSTYLCYNRPTVADLDNDGVNEFIAGAYRQNTSGGTYNGGAFIFEADEEFWGQDEWSVTDADVEMGGPPTSYTYFGYYLASGDFNGDDYEDLVVSAYGERSYAGSLRVYLGTDW